MTATDSKPPRPLDDVMIAMDVVDTLRHDKRIVERELNVEGRRAELIEELRKIYKGQGIDVPDQILEDGVKALEEKRFVYTPPEPSLEVRLARLYVSRLQWGKPVLAALAGGAILLGGWYGLVERPRVLEAAAVKRELESELPRRVAAIAEQISRETASAAAQAEAKQLAESARTVAAGGDHAAAKQAEQRLLSLVAEIRREFEVRIVNRQGEVTGLWRVPRVNPQSRNYYLVVEALDKAGKAIPREILNEETGQRETVTKWAVRVTKQLFDEVQADKLDDGIIQRAVLATKAPGEVEPKWRVAVPGGALTRW